MTMVLARRHVDAGLDDGRAQQHVEALGDEVAHHALELALGHLAVRHGDARLGQQLLAASRAGSRWSRPRCAGSRPGRRASARAARPRGSTPLPSLRTKVLIARRRCGAVAMTDRSRRPSSAMPSVRGIGVAVSVSTSTSARIAFIASLWRTPKRCSSSMIEQAQVLELDVGSTAACACRRRCRCVPSARPFERGLDFLGRAEARQLGDLDRPLAEAVDQRLVVLLGQQRGRRQDRDLLAAGDGDEGGAQRDLGLAEADVAADQPVHRLRRDHVLDHGVDRGVLVGAFPRSRSSLAKAS